LRLVAIVAMASRASAFIMGGRATMMRRSVPIALQFRLGKSAGYAMNPFGAKVGAPLAGARTLSMMAPPPANLEFTSDGGAAESESSKTVVVVGKKEVLEGASFEKHIPIDKATLEVMLKELKAGETSTTWTTDGGSTFKVTLAALPDKATRNNAPFQPHAITRLVAAAAGSKGSLEVVAAVGDLADVAPVALAIGKGFPMFSLKSDKPPADGEDPPSKEAKSVATKFVLAGTGDVVSDPEVLKAADVAAKAARFAARLVDTPPEEMNVPEVVAEARAIADMHPTVSIKTIEGEALKDAGYGGIWGVGKGATKKPALVVLSHEPKGVAAGDDVCMVGKGIVFDTGGLSLKVGGGMVGMKADMGGAAGMIAAFDAAVSLGHKGRLHLVLCLAENAIGPLALRNDDVITCFSGLTVEINNTDAEGRLVLADGVAHAVKVLGAKTVVDMATLTGAQLVATGKKHAGILSNCDQLESDAVKAGLRSGDLVFPLLYCPELLNDEFKSKVRVCRITPNPKSQTLKPQK
jgi:leucyl aminopeptidase